ncbi:UvrB/UvrC motif-containing protein [Listeria grandensis]|uniref:UvrB/UvrC motif-containing protein n=1 Tax=Listeria grandensis TaxID=1494963 RepID=UPI00164DC4F1|nr:UvrB/UvrC motif-containing protein [Listeria grandensis]MBC6316027.1 excinuclease [Listeria grandensis]
MICQSCGENEANIEIRHEFNGQTFSVFLCKGCAEAQSMAYMEEQVTENNIDFLSLLQKTPENDIALLECEYCGMSLQAVMESSKLGCEHCYECFDGKLMQMIERAQNGNKGHVGKVPLAERGVLAGKEQLRVLQDRITLLVAEEAFEDAAVVRDQIRALKEDGAGLDEE